MFVLCFGTMHTLLMSDSGQRRLVNSHYYQYKTFLSYKTHIWVFFFSKFKYLSFLSLAKSNINQLFVIIHYCILCSAAVENVKYSVYIITTMCWYIWGDGHDRYLEYDRCTKMSSWMELINDTWQWIYLQHI